MIRTTATIKPKSNALGYDFSHTEREVNVLRYRGKPKAHTWHILQAIEYNLKRLPGLYVNRQIQLQS
ncbi:hypothetical protein [uncultured Nitrosomonas sp.]|uniref:hypothetical protein n=1 Tax=uncultured Nitrosomonas sp. TaxID=156424 RepID=UPI0025F77D54|nr:hypothetical protein [uncultured Nitrosomonas sp.]